MLAENLEVEKHHLAMYEEQLNLVEGNTPLRIMIENIIVEESEHVEELEKYLGSSTKVPAKVK
jgi:rubrerythrin